MPHDEYKMLYLQCTSEESVLSQLVYPVSCIQTFVYLLAPLFQSVKPDDLQSRLEGGRSLWDSLWLHTRPDVLAFKVNIKFSLLGLKPD